MYNDYELLYLAQENNEDAVNELRKKYNSLLYAKALSYSRSSHIDIKELLNETELAFYNGSFPDHFVSDVKTPAASPLPSGIGFPALVPLPY